MKNNFDRRKFLKASILSIGSFFVASSPLKLYAAASSPSSTLPDADILYQQAKDFFYRKKYNESARLFQQLILHFPDRYVYYDGYAGVLGAEQKTLEIAELYREGLLKNPENPYFMQRLALRIYDLCMGQRKAEIEFCQKYDAGNLFEVSADFMMQAIRIKDNNKGFYLDLQDILHGVERKNRMLEKREMEPVSLPESLQQEIRSLTAPYEQQWQDTRKSRKPELLDDADAQLTIIADRRRRHMYDPKEKEEQEKAIKKARKNCKQHAMKDGLKLNNPNKVERYAMSILEEDLHDTDTIGKLRKYYRKNKRFDKIITLNRYLHLKENSPVHAMALAAALARYGKNGSDFNEAKQLLQPLMPQAKDMPAIYAVNCYVNMAQASYGLKETDEAKSTLLQGLDELSMSAPGISYILLEHYAVMTGSGNKKSAGSDMLKIMSRQPSLAVLEKNRKDAQDPAWKYVDAYLAEIKDTDLNPAQQLKPLHALLKLQNGKSGDYNKIMTEIERIKELVIARRHDEANQHKILS